MSPTADGPRAVLTRLARRVDTLVSALEIERRAQVLVALGAALVAATIVATATGSTLTARARWNDGVPVLVASAPLGADRVLMPDDVTLVRLPPALAPADALAALPTGTRLAVDVAAGTPVTASLLADADRVDAPPGWRVVAVPAGTVTPPLQAGDTVDVIALDSVVATGAVVVESRDGSAVAVAVPFETAARTATAMHSGEASLVLATTAAD